MSLCRREGATVVEMLTIRRGSGFRRATGSGEEEEVGATGSGEGWLRLLATVGQCCDRGGCRGKKMRRARLEETTAARGDGCNLRLRLYDDGEEEWATVTRLRVGRQQRQGKRRRQRGSGRGGWAALEGAATVALDGEGSGSGRATGFSRWQQWQGGETTMRAGSRGGGGLRGEDGEDNSNKGREGGRGQRRVAAVAGDRSRRVWPAVVAAESKGGSGCGGAGRWQEQGGKKGAVCGGSSGRGRGQRRREAVVGGDGEADATGSMVDEGGEEDSAEGVWLERRRRQRQCAAAVIGDEEEKRQRR
ncbi:hypothetical protein GW17_00057487 [Ensete ventricosum]|nr:hypothetical protein GW17_00057487 [Ensete ventricosum]